MKNITTRLENWFVFGPIFGIWLVLLLSSESFVLDFEAIKKIPLALTIYGVVYYLFSRWLWKLMLFKGWLVPFPNLEGTWRGTMQSNWINPKTKKGIPPIDFILVIKQTFDSLHIAIHTAESSSSSEAAVFVRESSGRQAISYNYTNRPYITIRERSPIHDGAARLNIINDSSIKLKGEYWTSRCTAGTMELTRESKKIVGEYYTNPSLVKEKTRE